MASIGAQSIPEVFANTYRCWTNWWRWRRIGSPYGLTTSTAESLRQHISLPTEHRGRLFTYAGPPFMLESVRIAHSQHPTVLRMVQHAAACRRNLKFARLQRVFSVPANQSALEVMLDRDPTHPLLVPARVLRDLQGQGAVRRSCLPVLHCRGR